MNLLTYSIQASNDFQSYSFYSKGSKGRIKKIVIYSLLQEDPLIYNLAFGDEDINIGLLNDGIKSNNGDRDVVLATVASTIHLFCDEYGNNLI